MAAIDPAGFEAVLRDNGIPPRPRVLEIVGEELRRDSPDLRRIERFLHSDVAIAGALIKMANSPYFGNRRRVRSTLDAIQLLGLRTTAQAIACLALRDAFPDLRLERFWDSSAKIAALAAWLVRERGSWNLCSEDAYTLGLFRDSGIAILIQRVPSYRHVLAKANAEATRSFTDVEEDLLPVAHAQVGAMMTQTWWLPDEITEAIRHHHDLAVLAAGHGRGDGTARSAALIAVVQLAEFLYQRSTGLSATCEWGKLGAACLARLDLEADELPGLQQDAAHALS